MDPKQFVLLASWSVFKTALWLLLTAVLVGKRFRSGLLSLGWVLACSWAAVGRSWAISRSNFLFGPGCLEGLRDFWTALGLFLELLFSLSWRPSWSESVSDLVCRVSGGLWLSLGLLLEAARRKNLHFARAARRTKIAFGARSAKNNFAFCARSAKKNFTLCARSAKKFFYVIWKRAKQSKHTDGLSEEKLAKSIFRYFFHKTRNRNGARKVSLLFISLFKIFTFSASGKNFEKGISATNPGGGPWPCLLMNVRTLLGQA